MTAEHTLEASRLALGYGDHAVIEDLDLRIPPAAITAIVGANACGKSTLLRAMARLMAPQRGQVLLDGASLRSLGSKSVARTLGLLPQSPIAPEGIAVADLVARGRHPHLGFLSRWTAEDDAAVADALALTDTASLADRAVDELSGGQRQRVWVAMALAQRTDILLLDEPTTFLDVAHQVEVLDLLTDLNRDRGTTIVMVLHELNLAARYADHLVAVAHRGVHSSGAPEEVLTAAAVAEVFGMHCDVVPDPVSGKPMVLPIGRHHAAAGPDPVPLPPARCPRTATESSTEQYRFDYPQVTMGSDNAALLAALKQIGTARTLADFAVRVSQETLALIPGISASYNELNPAIPKAVAYIYPEPDQRWWEEFTPPFEAHMHEHPVLRHFSEIGDGPPTTWDDIDTSGAFQRTRLFREFYEPLGIKSQLAFMVPAPAGVVVGVSINRDGAPFTDRERQIAGEIRDHLANLHHLLTHADRRRLSIELLGLSPRQSEVAMLLTDGLTNAQIARRLGISEGTARKHLEAVFQTLGVHSRAAAVRELISIQR